MTEFTISYMIKYKTSKIMVNIKTGPYQPCGGAGNQATAFCCQTF